MSDDNNLETYQFAVKILNIEIVNIQFAMNNMSGRHAAFSTLFIIAVITIAGVYGKHFIDLYNYIMK